MVSLVRWRRVTSAQAFLGPGGSILIGLKVVAAEGEEVVDPVVGGEEAYRADSNRFICRSRRRVGVIAVSGA
jgi:hypothetical protein